MRLQAVPLLCLALSGIAAGAQERGLAWVPEPGRYSSARVNVVLPAGSSSEYRFLENGDGIWRALSGPLELSAFPREERVYILQVRGTRGGERFEGQARYVIDRLPPDAPAIEPRPGSYEGPSELRLFAEPGAVIFYSLEALDRPSPGFRVYDPARPPGMDRPRDGTRAWTLSTYAVDAAGNPGPISTARYVVEPDPSGPREMVPAKSGEPGTSDGTDLEYRLDRRAPGIAVVAFPAIGDSRVFAAVNPPDARNPRYYTELPSAAGFASLELSAPAGWIGPLSIRYARWDGGRLALAPRGVEVKFSFEDPGLPPPAPGEPRVLYPPGTRTALLSWEPSPFRLEVSVGTGPFSPYSAPVSVTVPEGSEGLAVRYRAVGPAGAVSAERSLTLTPLRQAALPAIAGLPEGGLTNREVRPRAPLGAVVRYEASADGFPPAVTPVSPLLDEGALFAGKDGTEMRYTIRFRAFADASPEAAGSDERFASFTVDRSPPPAPRLAAGSLSGDSEEDRIIAFEPGEGTLKFAAVEKGTGAEISYQDYSGPVTLEGSGDRPLAFEVYAYAVDEAGNRSETLGPVSVRIDRASVYVASWGSDSGGGGPRNPLATISAGVEAALGSGRRFVRVQGDVRLGGPVRPSSDVEILGGCDQSWEPVPGVWSLVEASGIAGPLFVVLDRTLVLRNLRVSADGAGDFVLAEASEGTLTASNLDLRVHARGELVLFRARDSVLELFDSRVEISGALFSRILEASGGTTLVRGLSILARESLGYVTAFSFAGGSADISRLRSESRTSGGFTLARGMGTRFHIRDSYLKAAGSGYCEAFRFEGSQATFDRTSADLSCGGPLTLASLEGGRIDILSSTFALRGGPGVFLDLRSASLRLGNSIVADDSGIGVLVRTDEAVQRGAIVRNALAGFRAFIEGPVAAATVDALNRAAAPPDGPNFPEIFRRSETAGFEGLPLLPPGSVGLGGAYPLDIPPDDPARPAHARGDVGAIEGAP